MFITFEGGEGSGKSTQARILYQYLLDLGYKVVLAREPGGTAISEKLRNIVLTGNTDKLGPITELLIFLAARSDLFEKVIIPSLEKNIIVICDRFHDSSLVYQGICKGIDFEFINSIYKKISNCIYPTRTYIIDIPPEIGIKRALSRNNHQEVRFEKESIKYHESVRNGYLHLSQTSNRYKVLNGELSTSELTTLIRNDIHKLLPNLIK